MPRATLPLAIASAIFLALPSCETLRFYGQATAGQWEILRKSTPNRSVLADPSTSHGLRRQIQSVEEIRSFATNHLHLPGRSSYGKYADLGRPHVVWVLYAAPEFSLEPIKWYYPTVGELGYRGYFREEDTVALAGKLRAKGDDVFVGGVDAYSTLGWFHDPVLNTFVHYSDIDLAEVIFHELTHRKVFHHGDTVFNESFANVVAEEGVKRWLAYHRRDKDLALYKERLVRRREFYQEIDRTRVRLNALYASGRPETEMRAEKARLMSQLQDQFRELRRRWGGHGLEGWLEGKLNNGHLVSVDLYYRQMPRFQNLLAECGGDLDLFFDKADRLKLSKLPVP